MWTKKNVINSLNWALAISSFVGTLLSLILIPKDFWWVGLIVFLSSFLLIWFILFLILRFKKRHKISSRGSIYIESRYGDILDIKKNKRDKSKPIVVIPVNSAFDTVVEDDLSVVDRIIDGTSIHGQWLKKYACTPELANKLNEEISKFISNKKLTPCKILENKRGNKNVYPLGTYVFIERDECTFLLFALTDFDEHNKIIKRDAETFVDLMKKLMDATSECTNKKVYIPLMGTNIALFGFDELTSFRYIKNTALNKLSFLRASISIVIYEKSRDKVSLYD